MLLALSAHCLAATGQPELRQIEAQLRTINDTFHNRLESTFKYQQAVLPVGYTAVERYLEVGTRRYLLEYAVNDVASGEQLREDYSLRLVNHDTLRVGKATYRLGVKIDIDKTGIESSFGAFSDYAYDSPSVEAANLHITQNFDPLLVLALRPGPVQPKSWLYVRQQQYRYERHPGGANDILDPALGKGLQLALRSDTMASYHLLRSRTGDTCEVKLFERLVADEPWWPAARLACSWQVELTRRRLTAEQFILTNSKWISWVRMYSTATDFTEECSNALVNSKDISNEQPFAFYRRTFQQLGPWQSLDTYEVVNGEPAGKAKLTFRIISIYH